MSKPEDISQEAWDAAQKWMREPIADIHGNHLTYFLSRDFEEKGIRVIARAILAATAAEREACAAIIDTNMLCGDDRKGGEVLLPRGNSGNKVGFAYAAAIRKRDVNTAHNKKSVEE